MSELKQKSTSRSQSRNKKNAKTKKHTSKSPNRQKRSKDKSIENSISSWPGRKFSKTWKKSRKRWQIIMELHKLMRVSVKLLPWILAVIYLIGTIFASLGIDLIILSYIGYTSLLPALYILLSSFTFKACI